MVGLLAIVALAGCTVDGPPYDPGTDVNTRSPSTTVSSSVSMSPTQSALSPAPAEPTTPSEAATESAPPTQGLDHDSADSLFVLVNKQNPLDPADYAPEDLTVPDVPTSKAGIQLRSLAATAAEHLFFAAAADGVDLTLVSAYRSHDYQQGTYGGWVERYGQAEADRISARPGHSEHQTGLAMDVGAANGACTLEQCFADTPEGAWVAEHAAEHGWIIRYPFGAEETTGYSPEPWHLRYLGTQEAAGVVQSGGVLETAWGYPAAPGY